MRAFLLFLLVFFGILAIGGPAPTPPITLAAPDRPPLPELKDAIWPQRAPLAPASLLTPDRLEHQGIVPLRAQSEPYSTDTWTRIAFQGTTYPYQGWDIFAVPARRTSPYDMIRLTDHAAADYQPTLNLDGSMAAFVSRRDGNDEIYRIVVAPWLSPQRLTNDPAADLEPAWSPYGDRIAFVRVLDDQGEIFRMNADGTGVIRLTHNPANDFAPSWSPDARQIVWARQEGNNRAALWVMNADGSGQRAISPPLLYLGTARWSPKGDLIAFDYDADGDGLNELAVIRPDGSGLRTLFDAETDLVDLWLGDWAPGADRLVFTVVLYIVVENRLAVQDSLLAWYNLEQGSVYGFNTVDGLEMAPVWRSQDRLAPVSRLEPLPPESPGPFRVSWSGEDRGISGIALFEVQVREGASGEWSLWYAGEETTSWFSGRGGHTYSFRVRARDRAGNVEPWPSGAQAMTTVENRPPQSQMRPLQAYERNGVRVRWSGQDVGGSGLLGFDVQYRRADQIGWSDWLTQTFGTSQVFRGQTGVRYYFRVRAVDTAYNAEPWRQGEGDTWTTLYGWKLTGIVADSRGAPVAGVQPVTVPAGFVSQLTDARGEFAVYGHEGVNQVMATWQKQGYGEPAPVRFDAARDTRVHIVMPPLENRVRNGDFEDGVSTAWTLQGRERDEITTTAASHTGDIAAVIGCQTRPLSAEERIPRQSPSIVSTEQIQFLVDKNNNIHLLQRFYDDSGWKIRYSYRSASGWSLTENVISTPNTIYQAKMILDKQNNPHIVISIIDFQYYTYYRIFHITRLSSTTWTTPQLIAEFSIYPPEIDFIDIDSKNIIHILFIHNNLYYTNNQNNGNWSNIITVLENINSFKAKIDDKDNIHVLLQENQKLVYIQRNANGFWTQKQEIYNFESYNWLFYDIKNDKNGGVHFLWQLQEAYENKLFYAYRNQDGTISQAIHISAPYPARMHERSVMIVNKNGDVHIFWISTNNILYIQKQSNGNWTPIKRLPYNDYYAFNDAFLDKKERINLILQVNDRFYYAQGDNLNQWSKIWPIFNVPGTMLTAANEDAVHFLLLLYDPDQPYRYTRTDYQNWPARTYALAQAVRVPDASAQPTLSLFHRFEQIPGPQPARWQVQVTNAAGTTTPIALTASVNDWQHAWADMTPWAGQTVTLTLSLEQAPGTLCAQAYVDDVVIGPMRYPDLWVTAPALNLVPGETADLRLFYGNAGQAMAPSTRLILTLPPELTPVSADPPPTAMPGDRVWRWDIGDLPPGAGPRTITLTVTAAAGSEAGAVLTGTAHIGADAVEPVYADNDRYVWGFVGGTTLYLPRVVGR